MTTGWYCSKTFGSGSYTGRAEIAAFIEDVRRELVWTHHILTNGDIHIDADGLHARGRWYLQALEDVLLKDGQIAGYEVFAEYNDTFAKCNGKWCLLEVRPVVHVVRRVNSGWRIRNTD
ncbi:nuclear transport factor 2 family protein [Komagataeibacter sp. FNDCF1]|uniref:nuclear transport factor 2 family protein n=1 Tax=Komagataeibacter sp. FNDCF1 TaxID=2878681 RepID=UPI00351D069D|nr:nuclear transport factor 2 family protein [Komagataeibacter sp. FNDCF1]